jgi:hypothetical protein
MRPPVHDAFPQDIQTDPDAHGNAVAIIPGQQKGTAACVKSQRSLRSADIGDQRLAWLHWPTEQIWLCDKSQIR